MKNIYLFLIFYDFFKLFYIINEKIYILLLKIDIY